METYFDVNRQPKINLLVKGSRKSGILVALLDTGFDGYLSLPITLAISLGLELISVTAVQYADGRIKNELVFSVTVVLNGKEKLVQTTLTDSTEALAGTALFADYEVKFNFATQKIKLEKIH